MLLTLNCIIILSKPQTTLDYVYSFPLNYSRLQGLTEREYLLLEIFYSKLFIPAKNSVLQ